MSMKGVTPLLNEQQREIYNEVVHAVTTNIGGVFFVYGHGGTGKTFLYKTIIARLRAEKRIVLAVASSGKSKKFNQVLNEKLIEIYSYKHLITKNVIKVS